MQWVVRKIILLSSRLFDFHVKCCPGIILQIKCQNIFFSGFQFHRKGLRHSGILIENKAPFYHSDSQNVFSRRRLRIRHKASPCCGGSVTFIDNLYTCSIAFIRNDPVFPAFFCSKRDLERGIITVAYLQSVFAGEKLQNDRKIGIIVDAQKTEAREIIQAYWFSGNFSWRGTIYFP